MKTGKIRIDVNDIIGKCSGKLKVVSYQGHSYSLTRGGYKVRHYYVCHCECGNVHIVQRAQIKNQIIHSCGCGRKRT